MVPEWYLGRSEAEQGPLHPANYYVNIETRSQQIYSIWSHRRYPHTCEIEMDVPGLEVSRKLRDVQILRFFDSSDTFDFAVSICRLHS